MPDRDARGADLFEHPHPRRAAVAVDAIFALVAGEGVEQALCLGARADDLRPMFLGGARHDPRADRIDPVDRRQVQRRDRTERVEPRGHVAQTGERQSACEADFGAVSSIAMFEIRPGHHRTGDIVLFDP